MNEHNDNNIFICQFVMMRVIDKYQNRTLVIISLLKTLYCPTCKLIPLFAFLYLNCKYYIYTYAYMVGLNNDF